jgi:5,10-methenyltetrahydrofolate synthetase
MAEGVYGIPYPLDTPVLSPAAALVPVNGFDEEGFRLGYGGGYFDRTLAALDPRPVTIGLGYEISRIPTIHPRPHDIPLDFFVSEVGILARDPGGVRRVEAEEATSLVRGRLEQLVS